PSNDNPTGPTCGPDPTANNAPDIHRRPSRPPHPRHATRRTNTNTTTDPTRRGCAQRNGVIVMRRVRRLQVAGEEQGDLARVGHDQSELVVGEWPAGHRVAQLDQLEGELFVLAGDSD